MTTHSVTLVSSNATWEGIPWKKSDRRVQHCTIKQIFVASTGESLPAMPLERIIIEGPLESTEFLVLLSTLHPSFTGDVLFIDGPDHAFLSAMADGGSRVMYTLTAADIDFYVDVNGLRERAEETGFMLLADPLKTRLSEQSMRVLIAETDPKTVKSVTSVLSDLGCEALVARSGCEAVRLVAQRRPHVLLFGGLHPETRGSIVRLAKKVRSDYPARAIIVSKGDAEPEHGVDGYLRKPVVFDQIGSAIFGAAAN